MWAGEGALGASGSESESASGSGSESASGSGSESMAEPGSWGWGCNWPKCRFTQGHLVTGMVMRWTGTLPFSL